MYSQRVIPFYLSFLFAVLRMEPSSLPAKCFYYFTVCSEGMHADTLYKLSAVLYKVSLVVEHGPRQGIKHLFGNSGTQKLRHSTRAEM